MNIELDDAEGELLVKALVGGGIATLAETRTLGGIADRIEAKLPRPFKKGDIVYSHDSTARWTSRMEVRAVDEDEFGNIALWCLDNDGDYDTWNPDELARGMRP